VTDLAAILAEIDELAGPPTIQRDDVTVQMLMDHWGVADGTVRTWMQPRVDDGTFETLMVYDPASRRSVRVWRKVD